MFDVRFLALLVTAVLLTACRDASSARALEFHAQAPLPSTASAWPEADLLFRSDPRWLGGDAAFSVHLGGERVLWLFGDTFIATSERHLRSEARMVRNTIAVQQGLDPSSARIEFHWQAGPGSWFPEQGAQWFWPQHGVCLPGGPLILFWSRMQRTGDGMFGFEARGWTAVIIDNPEDSPSAWRPRTLEPAALPPGILAAQGLFIEGEFVYGLGVREPGDHAGFALRFPIEALRQGELRTLEVWDGQWTRARADLAPRAVMPDAAPELSLHFERALDRYIHVRSLGFGATTLAIATANCITGPWSAPLELYRPPESDRAQTLVYAGKGHPELTGADLVLTYASNSFDFAALVNDPTHYYPRFVRVTYGADLDRGTR